MIITLYIYDKASGSYLYQDTGTPNDIIADLSDDKDFTLTAPPDGTKTWRWVDGAWV